MESSPLFDLNEAIQRWRESFAGQRIFGADELEELENHLRESVSELRAGGLGVGEAFLIPAERLGSAQRLAEEYAKTNARRIWTARAAWMLGGVVASLSLDPVVRTGLSISYHLNRWLGLDAHLVVTLDFLTQWTICAAGIGLGVWLVARRNRWVTSAVSKCFKRPVWTGAALLLGLLGLQVLSTLAAHCWQKHLPDAALSPAGSATLRAWGSSAMALNHLACIATIPLLASYLWKTARTETASLPALPFDRLQSNERTLAGQLEAQGLSSSESHLVIAWRRGYGPVSAEAKTRFISDLWLERGFWMIVGLVANWMVQDYVARLPGCWCIRTDLMRPAFNNLKNSWKSRGRGIIGVGSLAQQFHPFKAFPDGLAAPILQLAPALVQVSNRNFPPVDPSRSRQWRYHAAKITKAGMM